MIEVTTIEVATGRIVRTGTTPVRPSDTVEYVTIDGIWPPTYYYGLNGVPMPRAPLAVTLDKTSMTLGETATLSGLPMPCIVRVEADGVLVTDGVLRLTPSTPGGYMLVVDEVEHQQGLWLLEVLE